ncbi:uncharacterized protein O3C94_020114 [Discoglossus pictus]
MAGPFDEIPIKNLRISPLGLVPKKEPGSFRLIHHLSYPRGLSVNDGIDKELSSVSYASVKQAVQLVRRAGKGAWLAKVDIKSAFRLLPVNPDSFHLLGCQIGGKIFVDQCLPMGCCISCSYFEKFSSFLHWVLCVKTGLSSVVHYLDDFLFIGSSDSLDCIQLMQGFQELAVDFGIPLAEDKSEGPEEDQDQGVGDLAVAVAPARYQREDGARGRPDGQSPQGVRRDVGTPRWQCPL